ncbi:MAG: hypothetical protein AAGN15_00015 [Cyanobacteria bacterium J06581_3]
MTISQATRRYISSLDLENKSVFIQCLDSNEKPLFNASGFILKEQEQLFLYACWHVVTGFDPHDVKIPPLPPPERLFLSARFRYSREVQPGLHKTEHKNLEIDLYDTPERPRTPLWQQQSQETPNVDLNSVNIRVPSLYDIVKIPLSFPEENNYTFINNVVMSQDDCFFNHQVSALPSDQACIVGYPYGYGALEMDYPDPIVLTRCVASRFRRNPPNLKCTFFSMVLVPQACQVAPFFKKRNPILSFRNLYRRYLS